MSKVAISVLFSILFSGFALAAPFEKAEPVWAEGKATNLNGEPIRTIRFRVPEGMRQAAVLSAGGVWRTLAVRQEGGWMVLDEPLAFTQTKVFRFANRPFPRAGGCGK